MSEAKLKACAHCGGRAEIDTRQAFRSIFDGSLLDQVAVYCTECSANMSNYSGDLSLSRDDTIDFTIGQWNRRAGR